MKTQQLLNYARDQWVPGEGSSLSEIASAIDGAPVARTGSGGLDFGAMLRHAREVGGPALRKLAFDEVQKALGNKPITPAAIVELREVKPWMFTRPEAEQKQEPTNTGRGSSGTRVDPAPKQPNVFNMPDSEWRAARRKAGFVT